MNYALLAAGSPLDHVYQWVYQRIALGTPNSVFTPGGQSTVMSNHIIMLIIAVLLLVVLSYLKTPEPRTPIAKTA